MIDDDSDEFDENEDWRQLGMSRLEQEWDNPDDAIYDHWEDLYGGMTDGTPNP
jgi:hypothetical protein